MSQWWVLSFISIVFTEYILYCYCRTSSKIYSPCFFLFDVHSRRCQDEHDVFADHASSRRRRWAVRYLDQNGRLSVVASLELEDGGKPDGVLNVVREGSGLMIHSIIVWRHRDPCVGLLDPLDSTWIPMLKCVYFCSTQVYREFKWRYASAWKL